MPSNLPLYVLVALFVGGAIAARIVMRQRLALKLRRFEGRERLSLEQLHDTFYQGYEMAKFVELWNEIASAVEVPPELIRPTDRFDGDLGPVKGFPVASEMDDLEDAFARRCKEKGLNSKTVKVKTVDDYVKQFASHA
jgi:hypothetical protein